MSQSQMATARLIRRPCFYLCVAMCTIVMFNIWQDTVCNYGNHDNVFIQHNTAHISIDASTTTNKPVTTIKYLIKSINTYYLFIICIGRTYISSMVVARMIHVISSCLHRPSTSAQLLMYLYNVVVKFRGAVQCLVNSRYCN